jgi:hypothetical protein
MDILERSNGKNKIYFYFKKYSPQKIYSFVKMNFSEKIYSFIKSIILEFKLNKLYKKKIIQSKGIEENSSKKLIISLTSYPKRFSKLHIILYSLLTQTIKPNKVILVLSEKEVEDKKDIPAKILFLKKLGLEIKFINENYRSYNKLIPTLKDFPENNIITVDDDILYPKWFLEKMYLEHKEHPNDIICYRAHLIKNYNNNLRPYSEWEDYDLNKYPQGMDLFPTGVGGILYPPGSLNKEVFNSKTFLEICPSADDVWFKSMSLLNKTNCRRVFKNKNPHFVILRGTQETSLYKENVWLGKNDEQIKNVFKLYNLES